MAMTAFAMKGDQERLFDDGFDDDVATPSPYRRAAT
jgi:hypothetical protein